MQTLSVILQLALLAFIVVSVPLAALRGRQDWLSTKTVFLAGLVVFQITSALVAINNDFRGELEISNPDSTPLIYSVWLTLAVLVFFTAYRIGWPSHRLAALVPRTNAFASPTSMLLFAMTMLGVGILFRHVLIYIPVLGVLTGMLGAGLLGASAAVAAFVAAPRLNRPDIVVGAAMIIAGALLAVIVGSFGRRDILSVLIAVMWGGYFGHWRSRGPIGAGWRLAAIGAVALVIISAFTAARHVHRKDDGVAATLTRLMNADIGSGLESMLDGQQAALNSMWIVENYPDNFDYQPLASLHYLVVLPVPRVIWESKPEGLGLRLVDQARAGRGKSGGFTLGPGLIGHIVSDNPWLSLVPYMIGLALFFRFLDDVVRWSSHDPFVVIPVGVALGQILGIARGELGLFVFQSIVAIVAAWIAMFVIAKFLELFGWRRDEAPALGWWADDEQEERWIDDEEYAPGYDAAQ